MLLNWIVVCLFDEFCSRTRGTNRQSDVFSVKCRTLATYCTNLFKTLADVDTFTHLHMALLTTNTAAAAAALGRGFEKKQTKIGMKKEILSLIILF